MLAPSSETPPRKRHTARAKQSGKEAKLSASFEEPRVGCCARREGSKPFASLASRQSQRTSEDEPALEFNHTARESRARRSEQRIRDRRTNRWRARAIVAIGNRCCRATKRERRKNQNVKRVEEVRAKLEL